MLNQAYPKESYNLGIVEN